MRSSTSPAASPGRAPRNHRRRLGRNDERQCARRLPRLRAVIPRWKGGPRANRRDRQSPRRRDCAAGVAAYAASKAALVSLVRSAALENRDAGITANAILPGTIDTEANRAWGSPEERAKWVSPERIAAISRCSWCLTPPPRSRARPFRCTEAAHDPRAAVLVLRRLPCAAQSGIEAIFAPLADAKAPGAAVLVIKSGRPFYERALRRSRPEGVSQDRQTGRISASHP